MRYSLILVLMSAAITVQGRTAKCDCLPEGISKTDVVSHRPLKPGNENALKAVTVAETLKYMNARCRRGRLVDRLGKPIHFFRLTGCWGNPPENYQAILDEQSRKLAQLRKRYTVIEMTCNPSGMAVP